jgi:hypothetical protein
VKKTNNLAIVLSAVTLPISFFLICNTLLLAIDVNLAWDPNNEIDLAGYKLYYGTAPRSYGPPINVGNKTTYTLSVLTTGTYYLAVTAYSTSGKESGFSAEVSKTLNPPLLTDTTAPIISNVKISNISDSGMAITWTTNEQSDTQVQFGTTTTYSNSTSLISTLVTSHSMQLKNLQPATVYHFRVKSRDAAGNLAKSADFSAQTLLRSVTNVRVK